MSLDFTLVEDGEDVYDGNYTHNVISMWKEAGCYDALYQSAGQKAKDIIERLQCAVGDMYAFPAKYKAMNSPDGWGLYKNALPFLVEVLQACVESPEAEIEISR